MPKKSKISVGDRVCLVEFPESTIGVVVFEEAPIDLKGNPTDEIWSVHWHTCENIKRRDMEYKRGIYSDTQIKKVPPKKKEVVNA